jgi:hypothetical protein
MQLPDDVLSIISAFSKPLPRTTKSSCWSTQTLDEMIVEIIGTYERYIKQCNKRSYTLEYQNNSREWMIYAWIHDKKHSTLYFTIKDIYAWDGKSFQCPSVDCVSPTLRLTTVKLLTYAGKRLIKSTPSCCNSTYKIYV